MDVREKLVELLNKANSACVGTDCFEGCKFYMDNDCLYKLMADVMIENGVTVQEQNGCEHCRTASYTENPFTVITQMGREVKTQFNFCPNRRKENDYENDQTNEL